MNTVIAQPNDQSSSRIDEKQDKKTFYVVASTKFWLLYIGTFGLYGLYWSYQNWSQFRRATNEKIWPVARSIFSVFFVHELYGEVDKRLKIDGVKREWRPSHLATVTVVALIAGSIAGQLSSRDIGSPVLDYLSVALIPVIAYLRYLAQTAINAACGDPAGLSNKKLTIPNILWIVVGGLWWLLALIGFFLDNKQA